MKKLFEQEVFENPVDLHIVSRFSDSQNKFTKPKELKGINQTAKVVCRGKSFQLFIDNDFNLWYKDNSVIIGWESEIIDNEIKTSVNMDKIWVKFTGIYERRNEFILDILREMCDVSEKIYIDNTDADNVALEDIYLSLLEVYLNQIKNS